MGLPLAARLDKATTKLVSFTGATNLGAIGTMPLFTVTGRVWIVGLDIYCPTTLVGPSATLALGTTNSTSSLIAATTATLIVAGKFWATTTPAQDVAAVLTSLVSANILFTIGTTNITAGSLEVCAYWHPMSAGGNLQ